MPLATPPGPRGGGVRRALGAFRPPVPPELGSRAVVLRWCDINNWRVLSVVAVVATALLRTAVAVAAAATAGGAAGVAGEAGAGDGWLAGWLADG